MVQIVVKVPKDLQGKIIGKQGATLKDIESDYPGVDVKVPGRNDPSEDVIISGPEDAVNRAKNRVLDICGYTKPLNNERAEAQRHYNEADELFEQAKLIDNDKAYRDKVQQAAREKRQQAEAAQREAAKRIFQAKNSGYGLDQIDLHGLYVAEALELVQQRLKDVDQDLRSGRLPALTIITGAGHHSDGNKAKIKPEIMKILNEGKYIFSEEGSGGILLVAAPPEKKVQETKEAEAKIEEEHKQEEKIPEKASPPPPKDVLSFLVLLCSCVLGIFCSPPKTEADKPPNMHEQPLRDQSPPKTNDVNRRKDNASNSVAKG